VDRMNHSFNNIDVDMIKANPSTFTDQNKIGPFLIGMSSILN